MQGYTDTKSLKAALKRLAVFHDARPKLKILESVHISIHYGWAHFTVYNMESALTVKAAIDNATPCSFCVQFRDFRKIVDKCKSDTIGIELTSDCKVKINAGNVEFTINAKPGDDYPLLPDADDIGVQSITGWDTFISEAVFVNAASSMDTPKNYTSGILFAYHESDLKLVGTDGRRLHVSGITGQHTIKSDGVTDSAAIVPAATVHAMSRLKLNPDAQLTIAFAENIMVWSVPSEGIEGMSHLLDTPYPDWPKVIPDDCESRFRLDTKATIESLGALSIIAGQQDGRDMVVVNANGTLTLTAHAESMGTARAEVPCMHLAGPEAVFALNLHYFTETLKLGNGDVLMSNSGSLEPARFDYPDTERIAVVMPVRLPD